MHYLDYVAKSINKVCALVFSIVKLEQQFNQGTPQVVPARLLKRLR